MSTLRVICLAGATGSGKTAAALEFASALGGEVINADSRQIYRDFPLITAQPSAEERAQCPHHMYGFQASEEKLSAGRWAAMAAEKAREIAARGKLPLLVGGTGLYFRALLDGIAAIPPVPEAVSAALMARCEAEGPESLHAELTGIDPDYALRIHPNDKQRVVRALEVWESTGNTFSWWHTHAQPEPLAQGLYCALDMGLDVLEPRLGRRIELMLDAGALEEAQRAMALCADPSAPGWSGIGCAELWRHLAGELSLADAVDLWRRNTRSYAKRQLTWFRGDTRIRWFAPDAVETAVAAARSFWQEG